MIIFLYGPDSYRRQKKLQEIINEYLKKQPISAVERFDFSTISDENKEEFIKLKEFSSETSLFSNKKMAILDGIWSEEIKRGRGKKSSKEKLSGWLNDFKDFLKSVSDWDDLILIISSYNTPPTGFEILLSKNKNISNQEFSNLSGEKLRFFVKKEAERMGIKLTNEAILFLSEFFNGNTWGLVTELEKLSLIDGDYLVDLKKLKEINDYFVPQNIYSFINLFNYKGSLEKRTIALEELFISQEEPVKIFNFLASSNYISRMLVQRLADYDIMVKSGKIDYEETLIDLSLV